MRVPHLLENSPDVLMLARERLRSRPVVEQVGEVLGLSPRQVDVLY